MGKMNFDEMIKRRGTGCAKWDGMEGVFGVENADDMIAMWIADADFFVAPEIEAAVKKADEFPIYGYKFGVDGLHDAIIGWQSRRFGFEAKKEWITTLTGVVAAVTTAVQTFTKEGDGVIIQTPVYHPFANTIKANNRNVIEVPLTENCTDNILHYDLDFDLFEEACKREDAKMFVLCSPHNPLGRLWTEEELKKMGKIARENGVFVVADEIHCDIVATGNKFTSFLAANPESYSSALMSSSASKSFNIAGLHAAYVIIPDEENYKAFTATSSRNSAPSMGYTGGEALRAAYTEAEYYVDEFNAYITENMNYMAKFVQENLPKVRITNPEATYLVWMDLTDALPEGTDVKDFLAKKAGVGLNAGGQFGAKYTAYVRINAATQKANIVEAMNRIKAALDNQ
ncbi:MAG: PatB family C-S lyase [Eubacteriaceae bacterium]|nr:PatB family C-S lyase [Eubacteriaceae bacterium]